MQFVKSLLESCDIGSVQNTINDSATHLRSKCRMPYWERSANNPVAPFTNMV